MFTSIIDISDRAAQEEAVTLVQGLVAREIPSVSAIKILSYALGIYLSDLCNKVRSIDPVEACLKDVIANTRSVLEVGRAHDIYM